ncbi:MAG: D-galactarate dehydratase [Alphaproteobacteria bacterium HGW-Alphaproteobacteria-2]|nr:MAG: D-galactarate dehydratase [Alphaproteobacteria bacterium HGW-Alphaproteobacteria-2]
MQARLLSLGLVLVLAGCSGGIRVPDFMKPRLPGSGKGETQSVEQIDSTTEEEIAAAIAVPASTGDSLGRVIGSLGNVAEGGFWLRTPLVTQQIPGRVVVVRTRKAVNVTLIPDSGGGHRLSLAAMRALEEPLTALPDIEVFAQ